MISIVPKIKVNYLKFLSIAILIEIPIILAIVWMMGDYREPRFSIYPVSDWLINYQGGFVRRGLTGEILLTISDPIVGILPNLYRFVLSSYILFITIFFVVYTLAKIKNYPVLILALTIQGGIYHMGISADFYTRKENLFLIFFGLLCLLYINASKKVGDSKKKRLLWLASLPIIFGPILILIHEGYLFMSFPLTTMLLWIACKENTSYVYLRLGLALYVGICIVFFITCSIYHGDVVLAQAIWDSLPWIDRVKLSPSAPYSQIAAINSIGWSLGQNLTTIYAVFITGGVYIWIFFILGNVLTLAVIACQIYPVSAESKPKRIYGLLVIGLIISSGMFLIAADWGRWIAFMSNQLLFLMFALSVSTFSKEEEKSKIILHLIKYGQKIAPKYLFYIVLVYGLVFQMPECCVQYPNVFVFQSLFQSLF
jgi:hypothetical protein